MKGTGIFVSGVVGGIVTLVWGAFCFVGGCVFMYNLEERESRKRKVTGKPHLEEVK